MNTRHFIRYSKAKQEFKEQMDPSDLSRSFFVSPAGCVVGFNITRSDGVQLEYNAEENSYHYLSKDAPSGLAVCPDDGTLDLPPYNYHYLSDEPKLYETHAFPDPSTNNIYETLRMLREEAGRSQFHIALAMTELPRGILEETELSILANKAALMYEQNPQNFSLIEITGALNELLTNGLQDYPIGNRPYSYEAPIVKQALLATDRNIFSMLITHVARKKRDKIYSCVGLSSEDSTALQKTLSSILPYPK